MYLIGAKRVERFRRGGAIGKVAVVECPNVAGDRIAFHGGAVGVELDDRAATARRVIGRSRDIRSHAGGVLAQEPRRGGRGRLLERPQLPAPFGNSAGAWGGFVSAPFAAAPSEAVRSRAVCPQVRAPQQQGSDDFALAGIEIEIAFAVHLVLDRPLNRVT